MKKKIIDFLLCYALIPFASSFIGFLLAIFDFGDFNIVVVPLVATIIYILLRKKLQNSFWIIGVILLVLVLTFTDEKWQLWIQLAHFVILLTASVLAAKNYGMIGFAWACLGANTLRVVAVIALGIWKAKPAKKEGE